MDQFLQALINGVVLGGFYAAMVLGFSIIWGVMGVINLAHGEFIMLGAFMAWFISRPPEFLIKVLKHAHCPFSLFQCTTKYDFFKFDLCYRNFLVLWFKCKHRCDVNHVHVII